MAIIASQYVTGRKVIILIYPWVFQEANIFSLYNLCSSVPHEELTASLASAYVLTQLVIELTAALEAAVYNLCTQDSSALIASPASAYDLSTEAP